MPYQEFWCAPEVFLVHRGVTVYHTYHHDDGADFTNASWYTLDPSATEDSGWHFDIGDFDIEDFSPSDRADHAAILRRLIEDPEWLADWLPDDVEMPSYRLDCPKCHADSAPFHVIACTFTTGPAFTPWGAALTPDDNPATARVQCAQCQAVFDVDELKRVDTHGEHSEGGAL